MDDDLILNIFEPKEEDEEPKILTAADDGDEPLGEKKESDVCVKNRDDKELREVDKNVYGVSRPKEIVTGIDEKDDKILASSENANSQVLNKHSKTSIKESAKVSTPIFAVPKRKARFGFVSTDSADANLYNSKTSISQLAISTTLSNHISENMKFSKLTKVQAEAIPVLLKGKDALIMSETGSGKTLAYAIPLVESLQAVLPPVKRSDGPLALVFAPTRELALQSYEVLQDLTRPVVRIVSTCIIGGQKRKSEKARIRKGVNVIVSTPGRFADHLDNTACLSLGNVRWLIFDEADRLLDMGFQTQINHILSAVRKYSNFSQQAVLLSATLSQGVEKLVQLSLKNPVRIEMKPEMKTSDVIFVEQHTGLRLDRASLPTSLTHYVTLIPSKLRLVTLAAFINMHCFQKDEKLLVFLSCRDSVIFHHDTLKNAHLKEYNPENRPNTAFQLHGGMTQLERTAVVGKFKNAKSGVIFCTDVAARGLDIPNVHWVLQYDSPGSPINYIHRVGRTARAGNQGNALLFLTPAESAYMKLLTAFEISVIEIDVDTIVTEVLDYKYKKVVHSLRLQKCKEIAGQVHKQLEKFVEDDEELKDSAGRAYLSFLRAYATYPMALKKVFNVRALHLGHVAKSFALKESPTAISEQHKRKREEVEKSSLPKRVRVQSDRRLKLSASGVRNPRLMAPTHDTLSEFSSGLNQIKKKGFV